MALEPYEMITSLGDWCAPAANIRRRFGTTNAMPFDWWVCPYNSIIKLLDERFENLLKIENLEITRTAKSEGKSVRCNHYGILHHHDFRRDREHRIIPDIESQLPSVVDKTNFILNRFFKSFEGKRVLFIRNSLYGELRDSESDLDYIYPNKDEQIKRAEKLYFLLKNTLSPRHMDIVILGDTSHNTILKMDDGSIIFENLGKRIGESVFWDANYDMLFDRLDIKLAAAEESGAVT